MKMPCTKGCRENRGITNKLTQARCEVCFLVDNNPMEKPCYYCATCDAWICEECWDKPIKRARAAIKRITGRR